MAMHVQFYFKFTIYSALAHVPALFPTLVPGVIYLGRPRDNRNITEFGDEGIERGTRSPNPAFTFDTREGCRGPGHLQSERLTCTLQDGTRKPTANTACLLCVCWIPKRVGRQSPWGGMGPGPRSNDSGSPSIAQRQPRSAHSRVQQHQAWTLDL